MQRQEEKNALKRSPAFLRTKKMTMEEKRKAKEVEEKKRSAAEKKRREVEKMTEAEASKDNGRKLQQEQCLARKKLTELKNIAREKEEQKRRELEDNYLRLEREEKRRLRISELTMAKV